MELKPVAMYREMYGKGHAELPSLRTAETDAVEPDRARILDYMHTAPGVLDVMESVEDLVTGDGYIQGGSSLHSDGVWIWRVDSLKYLADRPLALPPEFVARVREHGYVPPAVDVDDPDFEDAVMAFF
ncbi:hypothetical protein [Nocardia arizonensis]|uniref:hypothetical protein n=1 Tax=Nocardia arizonensis TaxID=1141647 RepID=UPI0006D18F05|nr:hypothetical protein [Nocardia arizonensis]